MNNNMECRSNYEFTKPVWSLVLISFFVILMYSCASRSKLAPHHKNMHLDPYGSAIDITFHETSNKRKFLHAEIIGTQGDTLILLALPYKAIKPVVYQISKVKIQSYRVYYSKIQSSRLLPFSVILTPLHGFFMVISLPVNILVFSLTDSGEKKYFTMNHNQLPFEKLHLYSRYPQGIPANLNLSRLTTRDIKKERSMYGY